MDTNGRVRHRGPIATIFLSSSERRLRAGWRLLLQALLQIVLTALAGLVFVVVRGGIQDATLDLNSLPALALGELVEVVTIAGSILVARVFMDRRSFVSLGLQVGSRTLLDLAAGIGITFVVMGVIFAAEWGLGWLTPGTFSAATEPVGTVIGNTAIWLAVFVVVGWNEELMSRGYHLQTIASGTSLIWGLVLSSAIFGALHLGNPNATWLSAGGIFFAGLFLGYAYIRTGQLWLSVGLHVGWNFFEGVIFGFPVSGLDTYRLIRTQVHGPALWTGGEFGPEAGLIVLPALAVGATIIYLYTRWRLPDSFRG